MRYASSAGFTSKQHECESPFDSLCVDYRYKVAKGKWGSVNQMPVCVDANDSNYCIESLSTRDALKNVETFTISGYLPGASWSPDPISKSPGASRVPLWHAQSDEPNTGFVLSSSLTVAGSYPSKSAEVTSFNTRLVKYTYAPPNYLATSSDPKRSCLWETPKSLNEPCAREIALDDAKEVILILHVSKKLTGWFIGRLNNPSIEVFSISSDFNRIVLIAKPEVVPVFGLSLSCEETKSTVCGVGMNQGISGNAWQLEAIQRHLSNKAQFEMPVWELSSMTGSFLRKCKVPSSGFAGIIASNATFSTIAPPAFTENQLVYNVAALHFVSNGEVFKGNFDLFINGSFARCLWGLSNAPLAASITVTSEDGQQNVATTSMSEKNSFIHFSARNFTFSSPVIKMKLSSKK
jgi:hypothetical protein